MTAAGGKTLMKIEVDRQSGIDSVEKERKAIHEELEIKCFYAGTSTLLIGDEIFRVEAGDVVVINPYEFHATINDGEEDSRGRYHLFMIPLDFFSTFQNTEIDLRERLLTGKCVLRTQYKRNNALYPVLMKAAKEKDEHKPLCDTVIYGLIAQTIVYLLRDGVDEEKNGGVKSVGLYEYHLVEPALRHIRDHYASSITLDDLAGKCKVNKHYLCRVFKAVTGKPVMKYLTEYRLHTADAMLTHTEKSISAIAEQCGFDSLNYFSRCYKKLNGFSPSAKRVGKVPGKEG